MHLIDIGIIIIVYAFLWSLVYLYGESKNARDFFFGNKNKNWLSITLSLGVLNFSPTYFLILFYFAYFGNGIQQLAFTLAMPVGVLFLSIFFADFYHKRFFIFNIIKERFNNTIFLTINTLYIIMVLVNITFSSIVFFTILQDVFNIPIQLMILVNGLVLALMMVKGGLNGSIIINIFSFIMLVNIIIAFAFIGLNEVGGYGEFIKLIPWEKVNTAPSFRDAPNAFVSWIFGYSHIFLLSIIFFGLDLSKANYFIAAKSIADIKKACLSTSILFLSLRIAIGIVGLIIFQALLQKNTNLESVEGAEATALFISSYFPVGLKGFIIAGLLCIFLSKSYSVLLSVASVIFHSVKEKVTLARIEKSDLKLIYAKRLVYMVAMGWVCIVLLFSIWEAPIAREVLEKIAAVIHTPILLIFFVIVVIKIRKSEYYNYWFYLMFIANAIISWGIEINPPFYKLLLSTVLNLITFLFFSIFNHHQPNVKEFLFTQNLKKSQANIRFSWYEILIIFTILFFALFLGYTEHILLKW